MKSSTVICRITRTICWRELNTIKNSLPIFKGKVKHTLIVSLKTWPNIVVQLHKSWFRNLPNYKFE
ncbi:MAG: DUF3136 domain-containing protein [Bacteroidetes bacterium]|nr:MAG: DUF3136 domain-containing protein [Bacteroidota bacterium]